MGRYIDELVEKDEPHVDWVIRDHCVFIEYLFVPSRLRGQGVGSDILMETVKEIRDVTDLPILLEAIPFKSDWSKERLVEWYVIRGFECIDVCPATNDVTLKYRG